MRELVVPAQQLVRGAADPQLSLRIFDATGHEAEGLTVTVDVARADGTVLHTGLATSEGSNEAAGTYTADLAAADVEQLDLLSATWISAGATVATTVAEVCGGFYFTPRECRAEQDSITENDEDLIARRADVEAEFERIARRAFVPRYARVRLSGSGYDWLEVPHADLRVVRSVRVYTSATAYSSFTADEIAALDVDDAGALVRLDRGWFAAGVRNLVIDYEYGLDQPPREVRSVAMLRLRELLNRPSNAIPDRAVSFQVADGGTYRLATPTGERTGNPDVDAVLDRWAIKTRRRGFA